MGDAIVTLVEAIVMTAGLDAENFQFKQSEITVVQGMWDYFILVGIGMTLIYFLMEMNRKLALEGGDLNFKSFFSPFLKLIIAIAVLSQGAKIVGWILTFNNTLLTKLPTEVNASLLSSPVHGATLEDNLEGMKKVINDWGFFPCLVALIPILLCWLISLVLKVVWWYKAFTYKLEMLFRIGITPIACADIYSGANSTAVRYIKGFLALGIYAVAMVVLPTLSASLAANAFATALAGGIKNLWDIIVGIIQLGLIAPFAALAGAGAARTAVKEALGC